MLNYHNLKDTWSRAVNLVSTQYCRLQNLILDIDQSRSGIVGFRLVAIHQDLPVDSACEGSASLRAPTLREVVRALVAFFIALIRLQ